MKRRELIQAGLAVSAGLVIPMTTARAQKAGSFRELPRKVETSSPGKVEVLEFFWYGCGHCFNFEPKLNAWKSKLPADVVLRKVPVGWKSRRANFEGHQKLFYALEAMGQLDTAHQKVFNAIHLDKNPLSTNEQIFDFAEAIGLNREAFAENFNSFTVAAKCSQAKTLTDGYAIDGVPSLGIQGQYVTSSTLAGTEDDALRVAEFLIQKVKTV